MDEPFEIEARGAAEGINPLFGVWREKFDIEPVSYATPGPSRAAFKQALRDQLKNKFVFVGEVRLVVALHLDEQKMLETPAYGDLDNYAKQLLDSIKGQGGLLIDDCQVQRLDISWIDVPHGAYFEIEITSSPDDFLPVPLKLYEMPDGLFYPISDRVWTQTGIVDVPEGSVQAMAQVLAEMIRAKKARRHELRQEGIPQFRAFQLGKYVSPMLIGFHQSRVMASGYELVPRSVWNKDLGHNPSF
jgi:hypothetical protein